MHSIAEERSHRRSMWASLLDEGGPRRVTPALLRALRIYGGARGIWVDKARTQSLTPEGFGVTVGLLATEGAYPDLLTATEGTYRYPETRIPGWDFAGISATKSACSLDLDVFLITRSAAEPDRRSVRLAKVIGWDDAARHFSLLVIGRTGTN